MKLTCVRHALVLGLAFSGWAGTTKGQSGNADPWSRVPAVPTAYYSEDDFLEKVDRARAALDGDIARQKEINNALKAKLEAMDPMEKARRMQEFMMKNPQEAMKFAQASQAAGTSVNAEGSSANTHTIRLEKELAAHKARFSSGLDATVKPVQMREQE